MLPLRIHGDSPNKSEGRATKVRWGIKLYCFYKICLMNAQKLAFLLCFFVHTGWLTQFGFDLCEFPPDSKTRLGYIAYETRLLNSNCLPRRFLDARPACIRRYFLASPHRIHRPRSTTSLSTSFLYWSEPYGNKDINYHVAEKGSKMLGCALIATHFTSQFNLQVILTSLVYQSKSTWFSFRQPKCRAFQFEKSRSLS